MDEKISRRCFLTTSAMAGAVLAAGGLLAGGANRAAAKGLAPVPVPKPKEGAEALFQLLEKRSSSRQFSPEPLPASVLTGLLWAAVGVNRPDGRRTAPTAMNRQDTDVYAATPEGLYLFDAKAGLLKPVLAEDIRKLTGTQSYAAQAGVNLVYVADLSKIGGSSAEEKMLFAGAHTGFISQNVYLYCAARGLATVVRASIDKAALAKAMNLPPEQFITLAQSVGYLKKGN